MKINPATYRLKDIRGKRFEGLFPLVRINLDGANMRVESAYSLQR